MAAMPANVHCRPGFSPGPNFRCRNERQTLAPACAGATALVWRIPQ